MTKSNLSFREFMWQQCVRKLNGVFRVTANYRDVLDWAPQEVDPKEASLEKWGSNMGKRRKPIKFVL